METIFDDYGLLIDELSGSPSGLAAVNRAYGKHLLLAAASSLEDAVKKTVPEIFLRRANSQLSSFVTKWVFERGYHTLFGWKDRTAQPFFASFGPACGTEFKSALKADEDLRREHDAFMVLGSLRNEVVHNDFATRSIDLTPEEIIQKYRDGLAFVGRFDDLIHVVAPPN